MPYLVKVYLLHPPVGVFIAILALLGVLVPLIREKVGTREKAVWTFVMLFLLLLEMKSIYQDRAEHEKEQADQRQIQVENFKKIGDGVTEAIRQNQQNFNSVMANTSSLLAANLGGDSFCFMTLEPGVLAWKDQAVPMFTHRGKYPLYGVNAQVVDARKLKQLMGGLGKGQGIVLAAGLPAEQDINIGDLPPGASAILWNRAGPLQKHEDMVYQINYTARNGTWQEQLRVSFTDGKWAQAFQVSRTTKDAKRRLLLEEVDEKYPHNAKGQVDWNSVP